MKTNPANHKVALSVAGTEMSEAKQRYGFEFASPFLTLAGIESTKFYKFHFGRL
jgi:hypothetical protein